MQLSFFFKIWNQQLFPSHDRCIGIVCRFHCSCLCNVRIKLSPQLRPWFICLISWWRDHNLQVWLTLKVRCCLLQNQTVGKKKYVVVYCIQNAFNIIFFLFCVCKCVVNRSGKIAMHVLEKVIAYAILPITVSGNKLQVL